MATDEFDDGSIPLEGDRIGSWFISRPDSASEETSDKGDNVDHEVDDLITSLTEPRPDSSHAQVKREAVVGPEQAQPTRSMVLPLLGGALGMAVLIGLGGLIWIVASNRAGTSTSGSATEAVSEVEAEELRALRDAVAALGGDDVETDTSDRTDATASDQSNVPLVDDSRSAALGQELARLLAATPIVYDSGQTDLTELQKRILNNVAILLSDYQEFPVTIVGYTDDEGSAEENANLSEIRANSVRRYLISKGVSESRIQAEGRGEDNSSGSSLLAGLERRVEIEVDGTTPVDSDIPTIRVGLVAPSASDDFAFTQSMFDALDIVAGQRGNVEVKVIDNTFVPADVAEAIREFAEDGFELIIAHGSQFGAQVSEVAVDYPNSTFAWGTAGVEPDLRNVYAYDVAAEEGGYLLGALAAALSSADRIGVVGPIEVGDAQRYIDGFQAGAIAEKSFAQVDVVYTGSFSDVTLAAEAAQSHVSAGADVLTGSGQMVTGAVATAQESEALWFGNQANQSPLAPSLVVASQVYHWEVIIGPIISEIDSGTVNGRRLTADLANGGIVIEYNPDYQVPSAAVDRIDELTDLVINGTIETR